MNKAIAPPWLDLAETIWQWGLVPLRAHRTESRRDPKNPGKVITTRHVRGLVGDDEADFIAACEAIHHAACEAGADEAALAMAVADALEKGARSAVQAGAKRVGRLSPERRKEYRAQAAAARSLAQFLAREITGREFPARTEGPITYIFSEGNDRHPSALADLLRQRIGLTLEADDRGASIGCDCGPRSVAPGLCRVVDTINSLHWTADLLRGDVGRAKPQGAPAAAWKATAAGLRELFEQRLGTPLVQAVATLAGLAHGHQVPVAEVSRLSKP